MGNHWRYPLEHNLKQQEILAETVAHALSRIETLKGKDSECLVAEYKEWLSGEEENHVLIIRKIESRP